MIEAQVPRMYRVSAEPLYKLLGHLSANRYAFGATQNVSLRMPMIDRRPVMKNSAPLESSKVMTRFVFTHLPHSEEPLDRNLIFTITPQDGEGLKLPITYLGLNNEDGISTEFKEENRLFRGIGAVVSAELRTFCAFGIDEDTSQTCLDVSSNRAMRDFVEVTLANVAPKVPS